MMRFVVAAVLSLSSLQGAAYYVATTGSDSNPGTPLLPFRTLQRGADAAGPGDTVVVQDGVYGHGGIVGCAETCTENYPQVKVEKAGLPSAPITFRAEHKWQAVLDCELLCDSAFRLDVGSAYIVIQDFVITRGYWSGIHSNDDAHDIVIRGNRFEEIGNRVTSTSFGIVGVYTGPQSHNFSIDGNTFHDIGRLDTIYTRDHGLYLHGMDYTITNNLFYNDGRGWAIQTTDSLANVLIANNTFVFPNSAHDGQIMLWGQNINLTIRNNIFYQPAKYAITQYNTVQTGCAIDHNLVYGAALLAGQFDCAVSSNLIGVDPTFVKITPPYDFHLARGSPAIDAGLAVREVATDFDGSARRDGWGPDLGAYEYIPLSRLRMIPMPCCEPTRRYSAAGGSQPRPAPPIRRRIDE